MLNAKEAHEIVLNHQETKEKIEETLKSMEKIIKERAYSGYISVRVSVDKKIITQVSSYLRELQYEVYVVGHGDMLNIIWARSL